MSGLATAPALVAHPRDGGRASAGLGAPPDAPCCLRVGMPHLDAGGLSENWLLRYAGDLQWEAIARRLRVASDEIRAGGGERLYPTVVAVRGRYPAGLSAVRENDVLDARIEVVPSGRACAWGRLVVSCRSHRGAGVAERVLTLELLTTFAVRDGAAGSLRMMPPAAHLAARWTTPEGQPPAIARLARAARRGERLDDAFAGPVLARAARAALEGRPSLGAITYEPSPYADYNGAGLLYFASYVTIADSAERKLVHSLGLANGDGADRPVSTDNADSTAEADGCHRRSRPAADWALATSAVGRDVYYYDNLPLGTSLVATLHGLEREAGAVTTHVRLSRGDDGRRMADVITRRRCAGETP